MNEYTKIKETGKVPIVVAEFVRCEDCTNKKCWEQAGNVVCGIDGKPHRPDWFCAYGEHKEGR